LKELMQNSLTFSERDCNFPTLHVTLINSGLNSVTSNAVYQHAESIKLCK